MTFPLRSPGVLRVAAALATCVALAGCAPPSPVGSPPPSLPPRPQNPSPMLETTRAHRRIVPATPKGIVFTIDSILPRPVEVFIPERAVAGEPDERTLLVHFFSASFVPMQAVASSRAGYVLAVINLGAGSSAYERPFTDTTVWWKLTDRIREETRARTQSRVRIGRVFVSAFSAGYGGVRALLGNEKIAASINGVILLDGLHTSYVPERTVVAEGGALDTTKLVPFLRYAKRATAGEATLFITHSEIFPGTFASTTETTDWLIGALGLKRTPVVAWGPGGMQQLSEVRAGRLSILGFAGNTGPDHIDHLHGLPEFLALAER